MHAIRKGQLVDMEGSLPRRGTILHTGCLKDRNREGFSTSSLTICDRILELTFWKDENVKNR